MALLFDKTQNRVVDVADNLVNEALSSGNYEFRQGVRVPVVAPNGEEGTVLSDELGDLIPKGFRYLTQKEGRERAKGQIEEIREEEFGDRTGRALGLGALRGATLGLSDVGLRLAGEATGLEVDQALLETKRRNETASIIGEIGGGVGSFLVPGAGLGAVGRTLGALGAPTRAATELGMRAAQAIPGVTGATRAGRIARAPAAGAVEGAAIGVGQTISEAAMADPELTAEKALANVGLGAVFGGTLSALGRGGLEAADVATQKSLKTLAQTEFIPKNAKAFAGKLSEMYGKALNLSRADINVDPEAAKLWDAGNSEFRKEIVEHVSDPNALYSKIAKNFDGVRNFADDLKKESSRAVNLQKEILDEELETQISKQVKELAGKDLKAAEAGYNSKKFAQAQDKVSSLSRRISETVKEMSEANQKFGTVYQPAAISQLTKIQDELSRASRGAAKFSEISDALVKAKNDVAENTAIFAKNLNFLKETNPVQYETIQKIRPLWQEIKEASVDEKIFGNLAGALADRASNLSKLMGATEAFDKQFFEYVKKGGKFERVEDFSKIANFFKNTEATSKEKKRRALSEFNDAVDEVIGKLKPISSRQLDDGIEKLSAALKKAQTPDEKSYLSGKISSLEKQKTKVDEFNKTMGETIESAKAKKAEFDKAVDLAKDQRAAVLWLNSRESFTGKSLHGMLLGGLGTTAAVDTSTTEGKGLAFLGALGGALLANPRYALKVIYGLENAAVGLDRAARKSAVRFRNVSKKLEAERGVFKGATVAGRQALIRANLKLDPDDRSEDDEQAFQKHKERLDELASDPVGLYETLFDSMGENAAVEVPISTQAMFQTTARGIAFLQEKIPRDPFANPVMPDKYTPSFAELDKYSRYVQAVKNPRQIFRELESGILRPETVEAVKNVYPGVYQSVVEAVATELMGENEIPYSARVQLSTLLNIPAVKSLTPEYVQTVIESERQGQERPQQRASPQAGQMTQSQIVSFRDVNVSGREQES